MERKFNEILNDQFVHEFLNDEYVAKNFKGDPNSGEKIRTVTG